MDMAVLIHEPPAPGALLAVPFSPREVHPWANLADRAYSLVLLAGSVALAIACIFACSRERPGNRLQWFLLIRPAQLICMPHHPQSRFWDQPLFLRVGGNSGRDVWRNKSPVERSRS